MFQHVLALVNKTSGTVLEMGEQSFFSCFETALSRSAHVTCADVHLISSSVLADLSKHFCLDSYDLVLVAGGDGTVAAVASALRGTDTLLGILPLGTMNLFARDLGIPMCWEDALEAVLSGEPIEVDAAQVNGRLFLNRCSVGFYPAVIKHWQHSRGYPRLLRYIRFLQLSFWRWFAGSRSYLQCKVDDNSLPHPPTHSVFVVNNPYHDNWPGFVPSRDTLDSGCLGIYIACQRSLMEKWRVYLRALVGRWMKDEKMASIKGREMMISAPHLGALEVVVDGELLELELPLKIRSLPDAIHTLKPTNA
jgi:diacylglycerol kinase family enzyme